MRVATAAAAIMSAAAGFPAGRAFSGAGRGEGGKFLVQLGGAAVRAFRPAPVGGAHEDFAVALALPAVKFVDRHGRKVVGPAENSRSDGREAGASRVVEFASALPGRRGY